MDTNLMVDENGRMSCLLRLGPGPGRLSLFIFLIVFLTILWPGTFTRGIDLQPESQPVRFVVIGDGGTGDDHQKKVAQQMVAFHDKYRYEFVVMVGDNIYPSGNPKDYAQKFENPYSALLERGVKFYAALGNHDVRGGNWRSAVNYPLFNMGGERYYSFTKGNGLIQFFMLDSTSLSGGQRDVSQLRWLEQELRDSPARWKIACFHHPIYSSGRAHGSDYKMRAVLEPHFINGGIRVGFSGHDHIYERIVPQEGIQYFITGSAGKLRRGDIDANSPLTVKANAEDRHFMYCQVDEAEIQFQAVSEDGEVLDSGIMLRPAGSP